MESQAYKRLAERLDALPNGYPATEDGAELRLLACLFTPEEADLASRLRLTRESAEEIAARTGNESELVRKQLKDMARRGLIATGKVETGLGFGLLPFVVGIYENQVGSLDAEMAELFEAYYTQAFGRALEVSPPFHRVIPIGESVSAGMEVQPFESAAVLVDQMQAWGVLDCICRKQKALIGDPCDHPLDVCMAFHPKPGAFDQHPAIRAVSREEALGTLRRAAEAGLVHSVSNNQQGVHYICNCCTCSCGILRGMAELGIANVVARSAFVNEVDDLLCNGCETCLDSCQFTALSMGEDAIVLVDRIRCVGCGVCVLVCPDEALHLVRRPEEEVLPVPATLKEWGMQRAVQRGIDLGSVL